MNQNPTTMVAIDPIESGSADVLVPVSRPVPVPGRDEVLIRVAAAGVNRPDILQRQGNYAPPPGATTIIGLEVAGTVESIGEGVGELRVGDRVCALLSGGGYAEYAIAHAGACLPVPSGFSMAEAAALPETFFTVWVNVFERAYARDGETLLVHGGTSGIGTTAIQLAKAFGLTVLTTCGSDEKCLQAEGLGADLAINYKTTDFVEAVMAFTGGRGADIVLDMVGGDYIARDLACLAEDGRIALIAVQGGAKATIPLFPLMVRRAHLTGSTLRPRSREFKALIAKELRANVWPLLEQGPLRPLIDSRFPLAAAAEAHRRMESGAHFGKIVLDVQGG
jgi:putative PIG3 family NAD(P)H quinone oxidoreductase